MIAAFLKTDDGDFNYPVLLVSLALLVLMAFSVVQIRRAFQRGCIWLADGHGAHQKFERDKNPTGFWTMIVIHCMSIPFCGALITILCFGLLKKPN
jgi:hypothetical protein